MSDFGPTTSVVAESSGAHVSVDASQAFTVRLTPEGTEVATIAPGLKLSQNGSFAGSAVSCTVRLSDPTVEPPWSVPSVGLGSI